jgi:hypothetical protein
MVRIQKRLVKKKYYGKAMYQYPVYSLNIPKKFHELFQPFLSEELQADIERRSDTLIIRLTPKPAEKRFLNKKNADLQSAKSRENSDNHERF